MKWTKTVVVVAVMAASASVACGGADVDGKSDGSSALSVGGQDDGARGQTEDNPNTDGGSTDDDPAASDCGPDECGPSLGAPNYTCDDGTVAGPGPCERGDDGQCAWTYVECPDGDPGPVPTDEACSAEECAPAPGAPSYQCDDGSMAGPICLRNDDGMCGWHFKECPQTDPPEPVECVVEDCGPAPGAPNYQCDDGSMGGPYCDVTDAGVCGWQFRECPRTDPPADECSDAECGPAPGAPNYQCDDGSIGGPVCGRNDAGTCGWRFRECPS